MSYPSYDTEFWLVTISCEDGCCEIDVFKVELNK